MRSKTLTFLLLTLLTATLTRATAASGGAAWDGDKATSDWGKSACAKRAPDVQRAIELYCRPRNKAAGFMVPGAAANPAKKIGHARITIEGACNPAQWLPWDICFKQFYSMCVSGNARGESWRVYGRNKCQAWTISNP